MRYFAMAGMALFFLLFYEPTRVDLPTFFFRAPAGAGSPITAHSHNDYEQNAPLDDALANRIYSVEADVWFHDERIEISHAGLSFRGGLEDLYLDPLQKLVDERGSVYGDGKEFLLWIEIKEPNPLLLVHLQEVLSKYPMLTRSEGSTVTPGPVTAILTGLGLEKRAYAAIFSPRYAFRDDDEFSPGDPPADAAWTWYSIKWGDEFSWNGSGQMPQGEAKKLVELVSAIHAKGRKIRFFGTPDNEECWKESYDAGVDLINTDHLEPMSRFLAEREARAAGRGLAVIPRSSTLTGSTASNDPPQALRCLASLRSGRCDKKAGSAQPGL